MWCVGQRFSNLAGHQCHQMHVEIRCLDPSPDLQVQTVCRWSQAFVSCQWPRGNFRCTARVKIYKIWSYFFRELRGHGLMAKECHSSDILFYQIYKGIRKEWDKTIFKVNIGWDVPKLLSGILRPALASAFSSVIQHLQVGLVLLCS